MPSVSKTTKPVAGNAVISFDYAMVEAGSRDALQEEATQIRSRLVETAGAMMDIGERLVRVRPLLPHGAWLPWLISETGMSEQWARDCIKLYTKFADQPLLLETLDLALPPTAIVRLSRAPDPAFEDVVDRLKEGERLRVSDVEEVIRKHRTHASSEANDQGQRKSGKHLSNHGSKALRKLADRARDELVPLVLRRMEALLGILEDADARLSQGKRVTAKELHQLKDDAQWLTDALEQLTQRRASTEARLVQKTFLSRPQHEPGPWADAAAFLADISSSDDCKATITRMGVAPFVARGLDALRGTLLPRSEDRPLPEGLESIADALSITSIVCLEDGERVADLGAHLKSIGTDPDAYRRKWGLPDAYPMQAPAHIIRHGDTYEYDPDDQSFRKVS